MNRRAMIKLNPAIFAPVLALLLSGCDAGGSEALAGTDLTGTPIGGAFTLIDKDAKPVTWEQFQGKYRVVYFGYTFCPDVCPVDVAVLMRGYDQFAKAHPSLADKVQPIFITVDPARDTPKAVGEFAAAFSPRLIGLTGSEAQVAGAIKAFRVYAAKGQQSAGGYLMDHSRHAYLMDPAGKPIEVLPTDQGAEAVARDLGIAVK
jgi:protein SCO1/2